MKIFWILSNCSLILIDITISLTHPWQWEALYIDYPDPQDFNEIFKKEFSYSHRNNLQDQWFDI